MTDPFTPLVVGGGTNDGRAAVRVHGAHVTSWTTPDGEEQLYLSDRSAFRDGAAIRGGIPVVFPQFSSFGPLPKHGFARTRAWDTDGPPAASSLELRLRDDAATCTIWPHAFAAGVEVTVDDDTLRVTLRVRNTGDAPFEFTAALHTYLRVRDVADVSVGGLARLCYRDTAAGGVERVQEEDALAIDGEIDRIYVDVPGPVTVREPERVIEARSEGFRDVVVWNPGERVAATIADLDPGGWRRFVCIEAATVAVPVRLLPGETWMGRQGLRATVATGSDAVHPPNGV